PTMIPSRTTTQPTRGLGVVVSTEVASASALAIAISGVMRSVVIGEAVNLGPELVQILEAAVDRRKTHKSDPIQLSQLAHDLLTTQARGHFTLPGSANMVFDAVDGRLHRLHADRALFQRPVQTGIQFAFVKGFPISVLLDNSRHHQLSGFIGSETLFAGNTLTPASHLVAFSDQPRINHLGVQ